MDESKEWKTVNKTKGKKGKNQGFIKKIIVDDDKNTSEKQNNNTDLEENIDNGEQLQFSNYVMWCHDVFNKNWNIDAYEKLCEISDVSKFWRLFNNIEKLGFRVNNFFFMKEGVDPIWEHPQNRNGGICSFKTDIDQALDLFEKLCIRMICNQLNDSFSDDFNNDINGISFSPKNNSAIIKIWNKDKKNDLSVSLSKDILDYCKDMSIKYKENNPEY